LNTSTYTLSVRSFSNALPIDRRTKLLAQMSDVSDAVATRALIAYHFTTRRDLMAAFLDLLRNNRNYRYTWMGQVVSEVGDHFNNIAVFSLALANTRSGLAVSGVMLSRAVPAILAGPIAGVLLDRLDRKKVMIASDLVRFVVALGFIFTVNSDSKHSLWLLYAATPLAQVEVISARRLVDREVIPQALALNPDFFKTIYTDLLNTKKTKKIVVTALEAAYR